MEPTEKPAAPLEPQPDRTAVWWRGLYMLVLMLAFGFSQSLLAVTAIAQFLWLLFTQEPNRLLVQFGKSLSRGWLRRRGFSRARAEDKPFPWSVWPPAD